MRSHSILIALLFVIPSIYAKEPAWPTSIGRWAATGPAQGVSLPDGPQQALLKESGFMGASTASYKDATGESEEVRLYMFHDSSGAYEAYTFLYATAASMNTPNIVLVKGNKVAWIHGGPNLSPEDIRAFGSWLASSTDKTPPPPIPGFLPNAGVQEFTQRYALGPAGFQAALESLQRKEYAVLADEAGFKSSAEAMFARYGNGKDEAVLLLIVYPTPQLAGLHLKHLEQALTPEMKQAGTSIAQRASLLSIVLAPTSQEYAKKLREAVSYDTEVTWNEPTHTLTDPPLLSTVGKIILFTCGFMVVAFVLGMAFGGVRILTKIFFPGKVFDRPEKLDVLQLGLSGKRINSRDFY
jgi:hypothetical protein